MRIFLTIILIVSFLTATSQSRKEQKGDDYFQIYHFDKAIKLFNKADSLSVEAQRKLAESYFNRFDFSQAALTYEKIINTPIATINDYYKYVLALKANAKYDEANYWMEKIAEKSPEDLRVKNFWENKADFDKLQIPDQKYTIYNLKMNTADEDFGPVYYKKNQLVFTSSRSGAKPILRKYNWNREPFLDIFVAEINDSNELTKLKYFNRKFNKKWHEGPASFKSNGRLVAFTRNNYDEMSDDGIVKLQLFLSEFKRGKWQEPDEFTYNSDEYSVGHPAFTGNGRILFFASDMPGGYGGTDLYMVNRISKNSWTKPINLGPNINTEGDEMFPFYEDRNKLLFFASNGKHGLGGLDVYVAHATPHGFEEVKNLGAPINSSADDFAFIIDKKLKTGYFSSNRAEGKGGDDLYRFDFTGKYEMKKKIVAKEESKEKIEKDENYSDTDNKYSDETEVDVVPVEIEKNDSIIKYNYQLLVVNDQTKLPIRNAQVKIGRLLVQTDSLGYTEMLFDRADTLKVEVNALGYKKEQRLVSLKKPYTKRIIVNDTVSLKVAHDERIELKNIYYDFDRSTIIAESKVELNLLVKFMQENPKLKVELSSHTDSRGSDAYNLGLSQRRAQAAVNYVISKGVEKERINAVGYGETRLVNQCANGVRCPENEHRQNRRTEIFIPGFGKALDIEQTKGMY